jgi:hypothetical protein
MPTFRSPRNPNFKLKSARLPRLIEFTDGIFSTDDPDEVRALRRHVKTGTLTEGEYSGDFHTAGIIPSGDATAILDAGAVITPHQAEALGEPPEWSDVSEEAFTKTREAFEDLNGLSNRELRERCADLGIQVPERAGKKALLDAIRIAEQDAADGDDDFDPNDPEGS